MSWKRVLNAIVDFGEMGYHGITGRYASRRDLWMYMAMYGGYVLSILITLPAWPSMLFRYHQYGWILSGLIILLALTTVFVQTVINYRRKKVGR